MTTSAEINELATALALAQGQMGAASKDADNPHFKSRYADLASIWSACQGPLTSNGLCVVQSPSSEGSNVTLTTRLLHKSGQYMESTLTSSAGRGQGPQAVGSTITYLRRYALAAMVGVVTDDDDGEAARRNHEPRNQQQGRQGKREGFEPMQPPQQPPDNGHHDSWAADRVPFCAWVTGKGMKYNDLRDWCVGIGEGKPSSWPQIGRDRFKADLDNWGPEFLAASGGAA